VKFVLWRSGFCGDFERKIRRRGLMLAEA